MGQVRHAGVALCMLALVACRKPDGSSSASKKPSPNVQSAGSAPSAAPPTSAPGPSASTETAELAAPQPSAHHCKALGKKGSTELSPILEEEVQLSREGEDIYALGYTHALARSRLYRFSRDGGPVTLVAEQKGIGERKHFSVQAGAAYYVQAGKLFKLGPTKDAAMTLREGVHSPAAVVGDHVLVIACDAKGKADHLLRVPQAGGEAETIADLPRVSSERCQYSSVVADEREVFIADWNGHCIFGVSLSDKTVRTVVAKRGFPGPLLLEPDALVYSSALGLYRIAREGGTPTRLADENEALAPYSLIAASRSDYWVFDNIAYTIETALHRLPRAGGASKTFMTLHNANPNAGAEEGQGLSDFTVDDECVYVAHTQYKRAGTQIIVKSYE